MCVWWGGGVRGSTLAEGGRPWRYCGKGASEGRHPLNQSPHPFEQASAHKDEGQSAGKQGGVVCVCGGE